MKKAIQFGAGNIGRGFIGALLENAGYHVVFADVSAEIIGKINEDKCYTVHVMDEVCREEKITNISGVISTSPEMIDQIASANIVTTAVGLTILPRIAPVIAKGITARMENGCTEFINFIACENAINGSDTLKEHVLQNLSGDALSYCQKYVGFPNCSVDRIVPPVKSENIIDVVVENYYEWNVDKNGFVSDIPQIKGMNLTDNLGAYIERKLFTLNTGHAITSYLSYLRGIPTVDEGIADSEIYAVVKAAMTESGNGLIKKYGFDPEAHTAYIDKIINRFRNKYLKDDVARVGREPKRKLSPNDRLTKPMMTAVSFGLPVDSLIEGIGAALNYSNESDPQSLEVQNLIADKGARAAYSEISGVTDSKILDAVENSYNKYKK